MRPKILIASAARVRGPSLEELDAAGDAFERLMVREMAKAANLAARRVKRATSLATLSVKDINVIFIAWQEAVADSLLSALEEAWLDTANNQLARVDAVLPLAAAVSIEGGSSGPFVPVPYVKGAKSAASYLSTAVNRLVGIGDILWNSARTELAAGMLAGESIPTLAKMVSESVDVAEPRATVIARTEVISASNNGSITAMRATEGLVTTKEWLATGDARTRPSHADAEGQVVGLNELFSVGMDQLDAPGDPNGSPEETINCRCTMLYGVEEEGAQMTETASADPWQVPIPSVVSMLDGASADSLSAATAPDVTDTTGMIALRPAAPSDLTISGGLPASELHVTLTFLGDNVGADLHEQAVKVAQSIAGDYEAFTVKVAGYGTLGPDGAFVVFLNGEDLPGCHARVALDLLNAEGLPAQHEPWIPHMTLSYGVAPEDPDSLIGTEIEINAVSVDVGNEHQRFPLTGEGDTPASDQQFPEPDQAATVPASGVVTATAEDGKGMAEEGTAERAHWAGVLAVEDTPTGDGREFAKNSLTWPDMPIPLQWQKETTHGGINDVVVTVGTVEKITRKSGQIRGEGFVDLETEDGQEYARRIKPQSQGGLGLGGVSIVADDPEHADVEYRYPEGCDDLMQKDAEEIDEVPLEDLLRCMEPEVMIFHSGRIRAVTGVDTPAFVEASIALDEEAAVAAAAETKFWDGEIGIPITLTLTVNGEQKTYEVGTATSLDAVSVLLNEVAETFRVRVGDQLDEAAAKLIDAGNDAPAEAFVSDAKWDGSPSRFTDEEYRRAAAVCEGDDPPKESCHLPHHEPGGEVSRGGVHAAAGGRGVSATKVSAEAKAKAKTHLRNHYTKDLKEDPPDSLKEEADTEDAAVETPETTVESTEVEIPEELVAAAYTVTIPDVPPVDWYLEPSELPAIGAITVTQGGRFFGLLAPRGVAHRAFTDKRVEVPTGNVDYTRFMNRPTRVTLADGSVEEIPAGVVTMNCGHAKPLSSIDTGKAMEHYADSCSVVATVRVGENKHGVWVAGALMPGIEANDLARLLACQLSGDWRPHPEQAGMRELAGALLVPVPGFATAGPSVRLDHGELVAAAAPVTFSATDDISFAVFTPGETTTEQETAEPVDLSVAEDLPDVAEVLAARDPNRRARELAVELGLDRETRLKTLVASVRGDDS